MKTEELKNDEQRAINGGSLSGSGLLNDDNILSDLSDSNDDSGSDSNNSISTSTGGNSGLGSLLDL